MVSEDKMTGETPGSERGMDEKDIIDAEVIAEHENTPRDEGKPDAPEGASFMAKAGWALAFGVSAFAAGVYFAPRFDSGLVYLGLKDETVVTERTVPAAGPDMTEFTDALDDMRATLAQHREILAQHEAALKDEAGAREKLATDMALVAAAAVPTDGAVTTDPAALAGLQADINRLSEDIARLSAVEKADDPAVSRLSGALALARAESNQLKSRLESVEAAMKSAESGALEASPRGRLVLSLGRLKDRALVGQPYGAGLDALRVDFSALPALDQQLIGADIATLADHAAGITPYDKLVSDFDPMAASVMTATEKADGNFLTKLFTVRRTDAGATGLDAELLKAERALAARDIQGAVDILSALGGPALDASAQWRKEAAAHVAVVRAFDRLTRGVANAGVLEGPQS